MTLHTVDWPTIRAKIIEAFDGELPGAGLEQSIIDLYEDKPASVINSINPVATQLKNGKINSGWAILKAAATKKATQQTNPTVSREKLIRNADQWLRNAGAHYDRWHEIEDELFDEDRGRLHTIDTPKLRQRYHDAYLEVRPNGEATEAAELERAERWKRNRHHLENMPKVAPPEPAALVAANDGD